MVSRVALTSILICIVGARCLAQRSTDPHILDKVAAQEPSATRPRTSTCQKNVSFAWVSRSGEVISETPGFADKWIAKNGNKHPSLCFEQSPASAIHNYMLVFSTSESAFNGIHPTVKTTTTTNTNPISGDGTAIDNQGHMWSYTFDGSITTTTTTTTHENLPYTDTSNTLYRRSYNQYGKLISERWYTLVNRRGGDDSDTAVFNAVSGLRGIHFKQRLLGVVIQDIEKHSVSRDNPVNIER
jgi:hypothetical protein